MTGAKARLIVSAQKLCISADSHVVEAPEVFAGLEERFGDQAPKIVHHAEYGDILALPGMPPRPNFGVGRFGIAGHYANDPETMEMIRRGYDGMRPGVLNPLERLKDQEIDGIDAEVLYPSLLFSIYRMPDPAVIDATFKNYNDWIANYASQSAGRLFPLACISLFDIASATAEMNRAKSIGHRGVCIPCVPPADRPYSDPYYEPFWAAAEELAMPMEMHIFTTANPNHGLPNWGPIMNYALAQAGMANVIGDMICGGVCARHPGLRLVPTEWETGWIGHFLQRLDWALLREPQAAAEEVREKPSYYFHQNFLMTFEDDRIGIMTRDDIGVRNLMWGSDYPHHDSIFPRSQEVLDDIFHDVSEEDRYRITVANCCELYRLPFEY
jgi:predicted TIM-barrel fold metal-dependent hydrolase